MKKLIVCAIFTLFLCTIMYSQQYVPFPKENAEWNVKLTSWRYEYPEQALTRLLKYSIHGDTIINEVVYHKLCLNKGTTENPVYVGVGGLREQNKQLYYIGGYGYMSDAWIVNPQKINQIKNCAPAEKNQTELLLYDFNVKVGDVVQWGLESLEPRTISKIDSIKIGNSFRKCYSFTSGNDLIVEGIGSVVYGLLGPVTRLLPCGPNATWEHICFSQNGEALYLNPAFVACGSTEKWSDKKYFGNDACWTEYTVNIFTNMVEYKNQYFLDGDTLMNGKTYKKITERTPNNISQQTSYLGALREDAGKVYAYYKYYEYSGIGEFLLYDFTVKVGDTIRSTAPYGELSRKPVVTKIDTIELLTGEKRKRFYFNHSSEWIEGIGCVGGLFSQTYEHATNYTTNHLVCYKQNGTEFYKNNSLCSDGNCCGVLVGVTETPADKVRSTLLPNPASAFAKLTFVNPDELCTSVEIKDFQGRKINTIPASGANDIRINLSTYSAGIYFVVVRYAGRSESHKLIKM